MNDLTSAENSKLFYLRKLLNKKHMENMTKHYDKPQYLRLDERLL